jgi:hypothetical protein
MRFRFPDGRDSLEDEPRRRLLSTMDSWWRAFEANADGIDRYLRKSEPFDLLGFMGEHLGAVDERFMWEFGPAIRGGKRRLVITPESNRHLRPMLDVLLGRAPRISGWEFYPYRLAEPPKLAAMTVRGRTKGTLEGWRVCVAANQAGGIDLTYWSPACTGPEDQASYAVAFVATESILGEELLDKYIDLIAVARQPVERADDIGLDRLVEVVQEVLAKQRAALQERPLFQTVSECCWSLLKLEPREAKDYGHQHDLFVAKTVHLPMWQRAHSDDPFVSARFSRCGETFCFVKVDGAQGLDPSGFADKAEIEDALDDALAPEELGVVVGGGTGKRYSYVDLALVDVERAIPVVRRVLRKGKIPKRSWLQFFDSDLASEWIGIWDDAPEPPGLSDAPPLPEWPHSRDASVTQSE